MNFDFDSNEARSIPPDYSDPLPSKRPRIWPVISPELHEKIKKLYQNKAPISGEVGAFAEKTGLPRWKISKYAVSQGWISKKKKEPAWSEEELKILERNAHHSPDVIRKRLKHHGFVRSSCGIVLKRKRMRMLQNIDGQSATQFALCLGEDGHFVTRAIKNGQLKAMRRIQNRTEAQGGPAYLIRDHDAREFILNNLDLIDIRKVDKYWFVDLLVNGDKVFA